MHSIVQELRHEHQQIRHILTLMGEQFDMPEADYDLLVAGSGFIANDLQSFHGAKEVIILDALKKKWFIGDIVGEIKGAHDYINQVALQLYGHIHQADRRHRPMAEVQKAFNIAVDAVHRNIAYEEKHLFPLAEDKLNREEWVDIRHAFGNLSDPLYGDKRARHHDLLYEKIVSLTNLRAE